MTQSTASEPARQKSAARELARLAQFSVLGAAFLIAVLFARHAFATIYAWYDDEGYMLLSIDHYIQGGHLYTDVYSQYGPFNFFAEGALFHLAGGPVDHDSGRRIAFALLIVAVVLAACFLHQISRNAILAGAAVLTTAFFGATIAREPGHPDQLILPIFILSCCISALRSNPALKMTLLGALGAALALTKINVGVFYFAALGCVLVCGFPKGLVRKIGVGFLLAYAVGAPVLLMRAHLMTWALAICLVAAGSGVLVFLIATISSPGSSDAKRDVLCAAAGALAMSLLIAGAALAGGMSAKTFLDGVLWEPLKHPKVFTFPLPVSRKVALAAITGGCSVVLFYWIGNRREENAKWVDAFRCFAGLCGIYWATSDPIRISCVLPLLAMAMVLPAGRKWSWDEFMPRVFAASLATTEYLGVYPTAGSQLLIAAAPIALVSIICVYDGAKGLSKFVPHLQKESFAGLAVCILLLRPTLSDGQCSIHYLDPASRLRGASSLHLKPELEDRYEFLANHIHANCDLLFSFPEFGGLNYFSGVPTPNGWNHDDWIKTFPIEQQEKILDRLRAAPRGCAVYNRVIGEFWQVTPEEVQDSPLAHYIVDDMKKVTAIDGFEIRVNPDRQMPWIEIHEDPPHELPLAR